MANKIMYFESEPTLSPLTQFRAFRTSELETDKYLKEADDKVKVRVGKTRWKVLKKTGQGAFIGAVGGGVAGGIVTLGNPVGIVAGVAIGGTIGGGIGFFKGLKIRQQETDIYLKNSHAYKSWRINRIRDKTYQLFTQELRDHPSLMGLRCSISGDLPTMPVRAPCGHTYEANEIVAWINKTKTNEKSEGSCPSGKKIKFTEKDLIFDEAHLIKIIFSLGELRTGGSFTVTNKDGELETRSTLIFREGIRINLEDLEKADEIDKQRRDEDKKFREGIIINLKNAVEIYGQKCDEDMKALRALFIQKPQLHQKIRAEIDDILERSALFNELLEKQMQEDKIQAAKPKSTLSAAPSQTISEIVVSSKSDVSTTTLSTLPLSEPSPTIPDVSATLSTV